MSERCMAVTGSAWTGPHYCGNRAKAEDANGRPICGTHKRRQAGIEWFGESRRYPEGTAGNWKFSHGAPRSLS